MSDLIRYLESEGYSDLRETPTAGVVGTMPFLFTHAIVCEMDDFGYGYRFCYETKCEADGALSDWAENDYEGEPTGYIVRKG